MKKFFKLLIFLCLILGIIGTFIVSYTVYNYSKELPNIEELIENYRPPIPSLVYDRKGKIIDVISRETRKIIKFNDIPQYVKEAFISIEDKQFYSHHGIHFYRLAGAMIQNIKHRKAVQGASSFTQQLSRNAFLSHEKSLKRKIKELLITFQIERKYTKDEIFEKYLNEIYFGSGAYGIETASLRFFRKNAKDLTLPEAALLAGVPNRPEGYNPVRRLNAAVKRSRLVLSEMYKDGKITKEQYQMAKEHKFILENDLPKNFKQSIDTTVVYNEKTSIEHKVPEFTDIVEKFLIEHYGEDTVYYGGLKIYSTLDLDIQKIAKEIFSTYDLLNNSTLQVGMATVDPNTGYVISLIGGKDFKTAEFNRATMAKRQLGSSFKPFLYLTAIQNGFTPKDIVEDRYLQYGQWIPKNYGSRYHKNLTLLSALDRSINTVSIQLLEKIGITTLTKNVALLDPELKVPNNLTSALGSFENTPLKHAIDFSIFANGGFKIKPIFITSIEDRDGNLIYSSNIEKKEIFSPLYTSILTYMLKSSVAYGSSYKAAVYKKSKSRIEQGGKTGTTNENRTLWYAGITPNYVTTIYIGNDDNSPIYDNATGGSYVAPLWAKFYQALVDNNLYDVDAKFSFLENFLKTGDLMVQKLDLSTGLISDKGRNFILETEKLEMEKFDKYNNGIGGLFDSTEIQSLSNTEPKPKLIKENQDAEDDSIYQHLLGN